MGAGGPGAGAAADSPGRLARARPRRPQNVPFTRDAEMSYQKGLMSLSKGAPVPYDSTFRIVTHDGGRALLQESQQTRKHPVRRRRRTPRRGGGARARPRG